MSRRRPLRYTLILAGVAASTVLAAAGGWRYARASAPLNGPIIVISVDALRADHLPAYGYKKLKTPAIDLLASNGVVFERAYAHAPDTLPAHVALLSGRLPFETGVRGGLDDRVRPGDRLLSAMLRERGYATAGIVSASSLGKQTGFSQGFDFFDDEMPESESAPSAAFAERDGSESEAIAERWLESVGTSRAFLFVHLNEPHAPYAAPARFSEYSAYDAEIAYADEIIGRLVHYLKSHQLYDRSTIVLLADHGEGLGDHGEREHGLFVYEEAVHVPLIIKQESNDNAGRRVHEMVQHIDLVPTILDLVKAPIPGGLQGRSLKPLLDASGTFARRTVYSGASYGHLHFGWSSIGSVSDGRYRFISAPHEELYDLVRDPHEQANLLGPERATPSAADLNARAALSIALQRLLPPADRAAASHADEAVDPKDKREFVERYREALDALAGREWSRAIELLQQLLRSDPDVAEAWSTLAETSTVMGRYDVSLDAYRHVIELRPADPGGYLGSADVLFKQRKTDEARNQALAALDHAAESDAQARATAHSLLARIALAKRDADQARIEAGLVQQADRLTPIAEFVDARVLYDQGNYEEALPIFQKAIAASRKPGGRTLENLHFYAGDTLQRLDRGSEAEAEFLAELRAFPHNLRASAALATLYQSMDRRDEAEEAVTRQIKATPTPESYAQAVRLLKALGATRRANAVRTEAARIFANRQQTVAH